MSTTAVANSEAATPAPLLTHPRPPVIPAAEPQPQPQMPVTAGPRWSLARLVGFRFIAIYFLLYSLPQPLTEVLSLIRLIPGRAAQMILTNAATGMQAYEEAWSKAVPWVGEHAFGLKITVLPNGSGDTTFNYLQILCIFVLAAFGTLMWSLIDRRRAAYPRLHEWLRVYVRYVLALTMLGYGMAKVIQTQFPPPGPERLMQTFGSASPMGLLWTFMGASTAYTFFAGFMECAGGLLLVPRRTVTLGALVVTGVMLNVVMLNFCYDVPVKQYSAHLLLMAIWLSLPDLPALLAVLARTRAIEPTPLRPLFRSRWLAWPSIAFKTLLVGGTIYVMTQQNLTFWKQINGTADAPPLAGLYQVESFTRNGPDGAARTDDASRWRRVIMNNFGVASIQQADDQMQRFRFTDDAKATTLSMAMRSDPSKNVSLKYDTPQPDVLTLEGPFLGDTISVRLRKTPPPTFFLTTRGFHWINEYPLNR